MLWVSWTKEKNKQEQERERDHKVRSIFIFYQFRYVHCYCAVVNVCERGQVFDQRLQQWLFCLSSCACVSECDLVRMQVRWRRFTVSDLQSIVYCALQSIKRKFSAQQKKREKYSNLGYLAIAKEEKIEKVQVSTEIGQTICVLVV